MEERFWDYLVLGGSHDGNTLRLPEAIKVGETLPVPMRDRAAGENLVPDSEGRTELYQLEPDGILYFLNVIMKDGERLTPLGVREPSRIIDGKQYFDYRFIGGSHDGNNMSFPHDFPDDFALSLGMRGEGGPLPGGKQEVYRLADDRRFRYQNAIMKDGKQVTPPRESSD